MADASDEAFPANDTDLPDTHGGLQPHQDASDNEWADTYRTGGSSYDELTSQSPADLEGPQRDVDAGTNWEATEQPMTDEGRYRETDRSFTDPGSETVAGYPHTWRTADQWHQASDEAAWEEEAAPPWHEAGRSAARLRSQIEQPPLNRDRLR